MKEAMLWEPQADGLVRCGLCAHACGIRPGERGVCTVRENRDGRLFSLVYEHIVAENVDPIEKKPLFHVLPGSKSFSIATVGCNFRCDFCQNAEISQMPRDYDEIAGVPVTPGELVARARKAGAESIAYTYTEPTVYFELAYDTSRLAAEAGLKNILVTNGYMSAAALEAIRPYLHAANVDLKSFRDDFYKSRCGARLAPVLGTLQRMKEGGVWLEVTTLLIPGQNDSDQELRQLAAYLVSLGPDIPWHISRYHPAYRFRTAPATPVRAIERALEIGRAAGLKYVYGGNIPGDASENTACAACGNLLLKRWGFYVEQNRLEEGVCPRCGTPLDGIFA